ncbi:alpha/beta hydrolase [Dickeya solani]|uniref:Lipase/esterase n=1 Tax=Dickeya solani D s0432-1 TaxID=1231725 RepID=A0AAV3K665_9GAMM|nr:alpha/beta hydrolase [Dickeya solani]ANE74164.1 alpha/beta hydrolase [Dickeya solani IPO 2222]AUC41333.1 Alpha/beta hydrolase fold-3 domain protein [Dickeya solani RNS 08.23.3.1.A]AUH10424.1 alpha/beta hydrolase [Dickeya solani D s0432-1]AUH14360.1 alpha/beta hydrolase [Dickeya solani]AYQ48602.1 Carboxylesterase NlhH [Dickeya solani]
MTNTATNVNHLPGYTQGAQVIRVNKVRQQIDAINGIVYSQIKSVQQVRQLDMSLLVPRTTTLKPAIVYFPGGGFLSAAHTKFIEMRMALAEAGFVVAAVEYRVVADQYPALIEDAKSAVRYLREHAAEYGIDPARIGVLGDSAGGYVAQMTGVTNGQRKFDKGRFLDKSSDVQAVATVYGISNLLNIGEGFPENLRKVHDSTSVPEALLVNGPAFMDFPGANITSDPVKALNASPMGQLNGKKPPFLIMHGTTDNIVSPQQSKQLYEALVAGGNRAEYVVLEGAGHGDIYWFQPAIISKVVNWFKHTLGEPIPDPALSGGDDSTEGRL